MFKKIWFLLLGSLCLSCQTVAKKTAGNTLNNTIYEDKLEPFPPDTIDGILVRVGTESILLSDLNQAMLFYPQLNSDQVLSALIDEKIIQIKAQELGIEVGDEELSKSIQDFLNGQNITEDVLIQELERNGKTLNEYREEFRKEIIKQQLIGRVISPFVNVSNDEVNRFYLQQTKDIKQVAKVKLRSLLVQIPDDYSDDVLKYPIVQTIQEKVENKSDFVGLVKEYSNAQDAKINLGVLPARNITELPPELKQKLTDLQINQVVGPIAFGQSVFFFQYLGADFASDSDLTTHFNEWKNKLLNIKFSEHLAEYLRKERTSLKIVSRPNDIQPLM